MVKNNQGHRVQNIHQQMKKLSRSIDPLISYATATNQASHNHQSSQDTSSLNSGSLNNDKEQHSSNNTFQNQPDWINEFKSDMKNFISAQFQEVRYQINANAARINYIMESIGISSAVV